MKNEVDRRNQAEKLGFHRQTVIPEVPAGMELVKFHGQPAVIPAQQEGETMYGKYQFTVRQADALAQLDQQRIAQLRSALAKENSGAF